MNLLRQNWPFIALALVVLLGGALVEAVRRYAHASGEAEALGRQRDQLVQVARTLASSRDSLQSVGDTLGQGAAAANEATQASADQAGAAAVEIVERVVEVVPDSVARLVKRADSLRVAQVDSLEVVISRQGATIAGLRVQLLDERLLSETQLGNRGDIIENQAAEIATWQAAAQVSWVQQGLSASKWVGAGIGVGYLLFGR